MTVQSLRISGTALLLLYLCAAAAQPAGQTDAELLLAFKASFRNGNDVLASWNGSSSPDPCSGWQGVLCTKGRVRDM